MPMPASATEKTTASPDDASVAETRTSPRSVNFSALDKRLRRIWETLPSSVFSGGSPEGFSKTRLTNSLTSSGRSMPRNELNRLVTSNSTGRIEILPASTLARSSRSSTSSES